MRDVGYPSSAGTFQHRLQVPDAEARNPTPRCASGDSADGVGRRSAYCELWCVVDTLNVQLRQS